MHVARVQHPAAVRIGPVVDHLADELHAEPAPAVLLEHVDVGDVDEAGCVAIDGTREADLAAVAIDPDDAVARVDQLVLALPRAAFGPVRLAAQIPVHRVAVEPCRIVVELVAVAEVALHALSVRRRKPPLYSYDVVTTRSASRMARSERPSEIASASGLASNASMPAIPSALRAIAST